MAEEGGYNYVCVKSLFVVEFSLRGEDSNDFERRYTRPFLSVK